MQSPTSFIPGLGKEVAINESPRKKM